MLVTALRQLAALLLLALAPAAISAAIQLRREAPEPLDAREVNVATAKSWGAQVLWVDARARADFEREHVPGAVLLNEDEWVRLVGPLLDAWTAEKTIVVYGDRASAGTVARRIEDELGIENPVWILQGGWEAWHASP